MFAQELVLKRSVLADILTPKQPDVSEMYIAAWMMDPYVDDERIKQICYFVKVDMT